MSKIYFINIMPVVRCHLNNLNLIEGASPWCSEFQTNVHQKIWKLKMHAVNFQHIKETSTSSNLDYNFFNSIF